MESENVAVGRRVPWNRGKFIGQKPPLKLREIGQSEQDFRWRRTSGNSRCSIPQSIASFEGAISRDCRCRTSVTESTWPRELPS